jgi:hypothetical protein
VERSFVILKYYNKVPLRQSVTLPALEGSLDLVHERYPTASMIARRPGHTLLELALAVDHNGAAIGQL